MTQPTLFDLDEPIRPEPPPDQAARTFAVDPANHVVLEASAGTGKTRVLVDRYVRLLAAGVEPRNILAMTFTRKAAAEMRARVIDTVETVAASGTVEGARMVAVLARMSDVEITTIDGFCFGLLREFPLEADVDPAFEVADETEMARFASLALDRTLEVARHLAVDDEAVRLLLARVKAPVLREALSTLVDRRHVAMPAVAGFVRRAGRGVTAGSLCRAFLDRVRDATAAASRSALIDDGPVSASAFRRITADLTDIEDGAAAEPAKVRLTRRRLEAYFLTKDRKPRRRLVKLDGGDFSSPAAKRRHEEAVAEVAPGIAHALEALDRGLDALLAHGVERLLHVAVTTYERLLEDKGLLDFAAMLERSVGLLEHQEEFARSRLKLQSRYHHLLIDEFQDTSRLQWRLIDLLIGSWAEGEGAADTPTSVFIVGDRKQSIYRFRHAEVALLDEAATRIGALRGDRPVRQAISSSFRSVPGLLAFVNALSGEMVGEEAAEGAWRYDERDRFPVDANAAGRFVAHEPVVGLVAEPTMEREAAAVADEIARLLQTATVRDRQHGVRPAVPDDIAILFRARAGHQYFEEALAARGVRTYVYKGLGFFDAPEVQDLQALVSFLAAPESDLAAAAFLRSRFVRLSDQALADLAPGLSSALMAPEEPAGMGLLDGADRDLLTRARQAASTWVALTRELPPSDLVDRVIHESAYVFELRGVRRQQAWENVKKVRALVRRVESRGYATFDRLASYFETLRAGDDANAVVDAVGAVSLMTIHAAKGLEFPIVFIVNMQTPGRGRPAGFSVIERGPDGEPEVTFGTTPGTRLEERRDAEELRRLLYVAVTRARDRVYLAAVLPKGTLPRNSRALAGLLPASLAHAFTTAATSDARVLTWDVGHARFELAVCRPPAEAVAVAIPSAPGPPPAPAPAATPVLADALAVESATAVAGDRVPVVVGRTDVEPGASSRFIGTLVHRLLQRRVDPALGDDELLFAVDGACPADELADTAGDSWRADVLTAYRSLAGRADLQHVLQSGVCHYEVPFSYFPAGRSGAVVRGVVDCVVEGPAGELTVVEFKTGAPRAEHQAQADLYGEALSALFGGASVATRVFYP